MGRIIVSENVSLDGVFEDPLGDEGSDIGGWFGRVSDRDRSAWAELEAAEAFDASALLLGRATDSWFAERWATRAGAWADRLNSMPKYVVSSSGARWAGASVVGGDVVEAVSRLKDEIDGDIVVYASRTLLVTLLEHDLVDELRLIVFPVILGSGQRLFDGVVARDGSLCLVSTRVVGDSLALSIYARPQGS